MSIAESADEITVGRRRLKVSNLGKVLYPEAGYTKGDVLNYYAAIADTIVPHLKGRPLTLKRYPNGVDQMFFYEKMCPSHRPDWVATKKVTSRREEGFVNYCIIKEPATLLWVANLASLELHTLLSRETNVERPTMIAFDLDPGPGTTIIDCAKVAFRMRDLLENFGLQSFPKTSGSKGLHFYVPLNTPVTFDQTKPFAHAMAMMLEKETPDLVVSQMKKTLREGKVLIDWSQNDEHKTTVCVYSLRARPQPTVSTPVTWKELETAVKKKSPDSLVFETDDVLKRVKKLGDLFEPVLTLKQKLPKVEL